jgi:hypothetical protein
MVYHDRKSELQITKDMFCLLLSQYCPNKWNTSNNTNGSGTAYPSGAILIHLKRFIKCTVISKPCKDIYYVFKLHLSDLIIFLPDLTITKSRKQIKDQKYVLLSVHACNCSPGFQFDF